MPAFASFSRGKIPGASWLASIRSRISISKILSLRSRSSGGRTHSSDDRTRSVSYARGSGWAEINSSRNPEDYELGLVTTQILGAATVPPNIEGASHTSIAVHQSMRQERLAI